MLLPLSRLHHVRGERILRHAQDRRICRSGGESTILDDQGNLIATGDRFANALVKRIESGLRMDKTSETVVLSNKDATIRPVTHSIAWFNHWTITGECAVGTNKRQAFAFCTTQFQVPCFRFQVRFRRSRIKCGMRAGMREQQRHLT